MLCYETDVSIADLRAVLDQQAMVGPMRHLLIELFAVELIRVWERPRSGSHFANLLEMTDDDFRTMLNVMAQDDWITCAIDMKTGRVTDLELGSRLIELLQSRHEARRAEHKARLEKAGPRQPTDGVRKQAHAMFEETCEVCGEKAVRGKDQRGNLMRVARIRKDADGTAENVTLLCSCCSQEYRSRDLPPECRSLSNLLVAEERGYEITPRSAKPLPKPLKEIVLTAPGPISVKTRTIPEH